MTNFIPIFPLELVVYPGEKLNLHIFEDRYKQLISECYKERKPFGIPPVIKNKIAEFKIENCHVIKSDVFRFLENCNDKFDLIFAGPPYALKDIDELPKIIREKKLLADGGWFILEHTPANDYSDFPNFKTARNYGTTVFSIFINN